MATRMFFESTFTEKPLYIEREVDFEYFNGFALSQKQKSIKSLHKSISQRFPELNVLEVSTKSANPIGVALSAFNLMFFDFKTNNEYPIENVFQSSKVFQNGGPYRDLLTVHPKDAKRDDRLKSSGALVCFNYNGVEWGLEPKSMFYDWLYIKALLRYKDLSGSILEYNAFTDIEFNHRKSINCQARAAAIFVSLAKMNAIEKTIDDVSKFKNVYPDSFSQTSLF